MIVNAMTETGTSGTKATPSFIYSTAETYEMNFPQAVDADKVIYKYASGSSISLPFQIAIDLRSMKLVYAKSGSATVSEIEALAKETLGE
jgi:hypothetical protein